MKPLILAKTKDNKNTCEEVRFRKSIKGALEAVDIEYATNIFDDYDLVHFVNVYDLSIIKAVQEARLPIIITAMYCEASTKSSVCLSHKSNPFIKPKILKCLNSVDLVLAPGEKSKKILIDNGVVTPITIFPWPINLKRFEKNKKINLFSRYFGEREGAKIVLTIGDYLNKQELKDLFSLASLSNRIKFYFLGYNYSKANINKIKKTAPKNVILSPIIADDIFCSTMANSNIFLILNDNKIEAINVLEAMAAKTQVVILSKRKDWPLLKHKENALIFDNTIELMEYIEKYFKNKNSYSTINNAYKFVKKFNLKSGGEKLKEIYEDILNKENNL